MNTRHVLAPTTLGTKVMALSLRSGQLKELVNPIRAAM
jgi:hypothetical protein